MHTSSSIIANIRKSNTQNYCILIKVFEIIRLVTEEYLHRRNENLPECNRVDRAAHEPSSRKLCGSRDGSAEALPVWLCLLVARSTRE